MIAGGAALGAGLGLAVRTAANFEQTMNRVGAVSGATGEEFDSLRDQAKELGRTTAFSASEAAEGMSFLAMAGFETDEVLAAMPGTLSLAAAGQLDLARAADIASNVLTGYGMEANEINRVNDVLAATASSANTDINQLGDAMSYVAPVAKSSGIEFEEASAAIGKLSDAGIQGTRAGTTLRMMIASLENQTPKAAKALDRLGISTHDAEGNLRSITDITRQFEEAGLSTADSMTIFGARAGPGMSALVSQGADALEELSGKLEDSGGRAKEMADRQLEGLNGALTIAKSAAEGMAIAIGEQLTPYLTKAANALSSVLSWIGGLNPNIQKFIAFGTAAAAAVGILGGGLLVLLGTLPLLSAGFATLTGTILPIVAPILAVIAVLAALALGIRHLWQNSETFRNIVRQVWAGIQQAIQVVVDWFMAEAMPFIMTTMEQIKGIFQAGMDAIRAIIETVVKIVQAFWTGFGVHIVNAAKGFMQTLIGFFKGTWDNIKQIIDGVLRVIRGIFDVFAGIFTGDWSRFWGGIQKIVSGIWSAIHGFLSQIVQTIISVFRVGFEVLRTAIGAAMQAISQVLRFAWNALLTFLKSIWNGIKDAASATWDAITGVFRDFKEGMLEIGRSVVDWFKNLPETILSALGDLGNLLFDAGKNLLQGLVDGIKSIASAPVDAVKGVVGRVRNLLPFSPAKDGPLADNPPDEAGKTIGQMIADGIIASTSEVQRAGLRLAAEAIQMPSPSIAPAVSSPAPYDDRTRSERPAFAPSITNNLPGPTADELTRASDRALRQAAVRWGVQP